MRQTCGSGAAKVILLGEHAVVHGAPALALALDRGVTVTLTDLPRPPDLDATAMTAFRQMADQAKVGPVHARSSTDLPMGAGLGSSAAFSVASARALLAWKGSQDPSLDDVLYLAGIGESVFHGNPSGVDAYVSARGGLLRFRKGAPADVVALPAPHGVPLVIADTGERSPTQDQVAHVDALYRANRNSKAAIGALFDVMAALVDPARGFIRRGAWPELGKSFDAAHSILGRLGVSTDRLDLCCRTAREAGALGAKLTGGGGGGCLIALTPDPIPVIAALEAQGCTAFATR